MRVAFLSSLVAFTATTTAILVTYPPKGEKIDWSKPVTIKWDSVQTDPATFDLYLVNQAVNPSVSTLVASDVDTNKGFYTIKANNPNLAASETGGGYQISLKSSSGDGILAQSQQFKVTDAKAESASASSSAPTSTSTSSTLSTSLSTTTTQTKTHTSTSSTSTSTPETTFTSTSTSTSTSTKTTTSTTQHTKTMETTSTASASTTSNAAGLLMPDKAGSLLLGLLALAL